MREVNDMLLLLRCFPSDWFQPLSPIISNGKILRCLHLGIMNIIELATLNLGVKTQM